MTNATVVTTTYFISSGRKNAMYTLRVERRGGGYTSDNYICNLSTDPEKAEAKAREYFDRVSARLTETDTFKMVFQGLQISICSNVAVNCQCSILKNWNCWKKGSCRLASVKAK